MKRTPVVLVAVLTLAATFSLVAVIRSMSHDIKIKIPAIGSSCTVRAGGEVTLDLVQMANAATVAAVGSRRRMPERAIAIALATALQESKLENLDDGDRDSVGLFQQRPSQGWGPADKIQDPRYAADEFYTALKKVKGWQSMKVTEAAQRVQRSAFPDAYAKWADESAVLAKALTGSATAAVSCTLTGKPVLRGPAAAAALLKGLRLDWGKGLDPDRRAGIGPDGRRRRPERRLAVRPLAGCACPRHRSRTGTFRGPRVASQRGQVAVGDRRRWRRRAQRDRRGLRLMPIVTCLTELSVRTGLPASVALRNYTLPRT